MNESNPPAPPAWVCKRDGQLVPFDADKISRALFAAGESLGRPDAFLARELADGVIHFLSLESEGATPTTEQISDLVIKIIRELGQPALAEAFARVAEQRRRSTQPMETVRPARPAAPPDEVLLRFAPGTPLPVVLSSCVREYTLQSVFTRDLLAAREVGLLTLTGLEAPGELAGCVLGPPLEGAAAVLAAIEAMRPFVGRFLVFDGPEYLLAAAGQPAAAAFARDLILGLRLTGLHGIINLNSAAPPSWAGNLAAGPLFAAQQLPPHAEQLRELADELAKELLQPAHSIPCAGSVRIDWHLGERDFATDAATRAGLLHLARAALEGAPVSFVFDRPRRPLALAEGVDRPHPAVLLTVGVHLPRLAVQPGIDGNADRFLSKLGSLARLALSAGVQKREYLRRLERGRRPTAADSPALSSGFLLDRARLVVAPMGLDRVVQTFVSKGLSSGGAALDFGRQIVLRLRDVLRQDGRHAHLDTCLDGPFGFRLAEETEDADAWPSMEEVVGLTAWDDAAAIKNQLRSAGVLHEAAEGGTLALFVPEDRPPSAEQVLEWLQSAWHHSGVVRLHLLRGPTARQLPLPA